ncbi:PqqD family protein [Acidobacteria bacterium ACD]|nr:MAG: PqqD family protein [Acidobacteriota bacterium]MCE7957334.1 PqqD family protein [Acidobacteria bacterium ACB2]MDL1951594.1 PqqD family protein [Acidobacteria bacterium ACD]
MSHRDAPGPGPVYRRSENLAVRTIGGETLLMPVLSVGSGPDDIFILNATGSAIWRALARPSGSEALVEAVKAEFEVGTEEAEADVAAFLEALGKAKLVREA